MLCVLVVPEIIDIFIGLGVLWGDPLAEETQ